MGAVWDFYTIYICNITASAGSGGTITPSGVVTVNSGADQTFTIAPDKGYSIADVLVDGASVGMIASYTFTNVTTDHTIEVSFAINIYSLTVSATDGSITKSPDKASYNHGETITLEAVPNTGYSFVGWSGDLSGSTNPASITMDSDKSVTANFAINTYSITASAGNGGQINPSGTAQVNWDDTQSYTITPNTGYHISDVLVDGSSVGAVTSYSFTNVTANHTIAATFTKNGPYHPADLNNDYVISMLEILEYQDQWALGNVTMLEVLEAMELWSAGHYYWDESEQKFKPGEEP